MRVAVIRPFIHRCHPMSRAKDLANEAEITLSRKCDLLTLWEIPLFVRDDMLVVPVPDLTGRRPRGISTTFEYG